MLSIYDKLVIAFYFAFMTGIAFVMKRFIRNTSDYFRGGGEMLWWMSGAGAFVVSFSAVVFTGMAGKAYSDGPVVLMIYVGNAIGFIINIFWFAPISRQTRRITAMQVVRDRFGGVSEQFFTWIQIPLNTLYAAIWLNGLCVFVGAAFGLPLKEMIVVTGAAVLIIALLGGSWSVMAGDFVQMLILMPVTIVATVLGLMKVGGVHNLVQRLPSSFFHWSESGSLKLISLWCIAALLQKFVATNSMQDSARYLSVKDTKNARKAAILATVLNMIGPVVWFLPPIIARVTHPNIAHDFPKVPNPSEAAYFAICLATMPAGMIGLLVSGVFGATMSQMDNGLNKNAGFFVKNFYQPHVRPQASERELLFISKIATAILGVLIVLAGLLFATWKNLTIFELMTRFGSLVAIPATIPMVLGLIFKKAPKWAGWSTVLVGLACSLVISNVFSPEGTQRIFHVQFNAREKSDWPYMLGTFTNIGIGSAWFFFTCLFWKRAPADDRREIDEFFTRLYTPVDFAKEEGIGSDNMQARIMGTLCMIYGGFILALLIIPNPLGGRIAIAFCGACMELIGVMLRLGAKGKAENEIDARDSIQSPESGPGFEPIISTAEARATDSV